MQQVALSQQTPRDRAVLAEFDVSHMLRVWSFISWILMLQFVVGVPLLMAGIGKWLGGAVDRPMLNLGVAIVAVGVGGILLRRWIQRRRRMREATILNGVICPARVTSVRPAIGLTLAFMGLDRLLHFDVRLPSGEIRQASFKTPDAGWARIAQSEPSIYALVDPSNGAVLIPAEVARSVVPVPDAADLRTAR